MGEAATGRARLVTETPASPSQRAALDRLRESGVLDQAKALLDAFRLPRPVSIVTRACSWGSGAFYRDDQITVCYGYLEDAIGNARNEQRPGWVSERSAMRGQFLDVFIHEGGHAVFEQFRTPLFGKEEDAADTFATYLILNLFPEEAPGLVAGVAYSYLLDAGARDFPELSSLQRRSPPNRAYGAAHSTPLQRMFNVVCLASGFDEARFREVVQRSDMPAWRARGCEEEYRQVANAFEALILPHVDMDMLRRSFPQAFPRAGR